MRPRLVLAVLVLAVLVLAGGTACSGRSCDELPALQEQREAARSAYLELARSGTASPAETEQADAELHALERRVVEVERDCGGR